MDWTRPLEREELNAMRIVAPRVCSELDHFVRRSACGQPIDCRWLDDILHEDEGHTPISLDTCTVVSTAPMAKKGGERNDRFGGTA